MKCNVPKLKRYGDATPLTSFDPRKENYSVLNFSNFYPKNPINCDLILF